MVQPLPADGGTAPLVYVVLLNWHGWRDTLACIDSLRRLEYPRFVVLVVDNGSTDDSVARLREGAPEVELIETGANLGFSRGCNAGIVPALARGADYVWLLNNDTTVDPRALSAMVDEAERDEAVGAVGSVIRSMARPDEIQSWGGGRVDLWLGYQRPHRSRPHPAELDYLTAASLLVRRKVLEEAGLDPGFFMYWEDVDFCVSIRGRGWKLRVAEASTVLHKESASLEHATPTKIRYYSASAVRFFGKHAPLPPLAVTVGLAGRVAKRLGDRRRWPEIAASFHGALDGLRGRLGPRPA